MGWTLVIDYGTSRTAAAIAEGHSIEQVPLEDERYMPSLVCLDDDGTLLTGRDAAYAAYAIPERTERAPKRAVLDDDDVLLGDQRVRVVELIAATLRTVAETAIRRRDGIPPARLVLTHPVHRESEYLKALTLAAEKAGLPTPEFVSEPVGAALWYAREGGAGTDLGDVITVFDFGGGTLDVAALRRTHNGYFLVGPPGGDARLGGEDVDDEVYNLLSELTRDTDPDAWQAIFEGDLTPHNRRDRHQAREAATEAKHQLSDRLTYAVYLPGRKAVKLRITRGQFEERIEPIIARAMDIMDAALTRAGLTHGEITTVYLTGGSSRIPRVHDAIAKRFGVVPALHHDPKSVVVIGAARWALNPPRIASNASETLAGYQRQLTDQLRDLGSDHPDTLVTRRHIANYTGETGDARGAVVLLTALLADRRRDFPPDDPETLHVRAWLAGWTGRAGSPREATRQLTDLLREQRSVLGEDHHDTLDSRILRAIYLHQSGETEEALEQFHNVYADIARVLDPEHPDALLTLIHIGRALCESGREQEALELEKSLLPRLTRVLGDEHRLVLATRHNIALSHYRLGEFHEALRLFEEALIDEERIHGVDAQTALITRQNIALATGAAHGCSSGIALLEKVLADRIRLNGERHQDTLLVRRLIAELTHSDGRVGNAIDLINSVIADCERYLEPDHQYTRNARALLEQWASQ